MEEKTREDSKPSGCRNQGDVIAASAVDAGVCEGSRPPGAAVE